MQTPEQANSREELREMLASRESGGIIFTTVQKVSLLVGRRTAACGLGFLTDRRANSSAFARLRWRVGGQRWLPHRGRH